MMNFINNGGLEMILAIGYMTWILLWAKMEDRRTLKERPEKWTWK